MSERCFSPASCIASRRFKKSLLTYCGLTLRLCRWFGVVVQVSLPRVIFASTVLICFTELVGQALEDIITKLAGIERRVVSLRENFDGKSHASSAQSRSETADELSARHMSLMNADTSGRAIRYRRDIHPCRGALQLIKGDDRGGIDQCHKKDMTPAELDRLRKGGMRGTFLFWTCDSCQFRIKYFVSKSCAASLLANDEVLTFHDSKIRCSRAFLVMSHLEQRDTKRISSSPRYTCVICALHRPSTRPDRNRTFSTRDDYVKHVEDVHINGERLPAFLLQKLCIENGDRLPHGHRRDLWTA